VGFSSLKRIYCKGDLDLFPNLTYEAQHLKPWREGKVWYLTQGLGGRGE